MQTHRSPGAAPLHWGIAFAGALALAGAVQPAFAIAYSFPGNLPPGCIVSGSAYTCPALTLGYNDTVSIGAPKPTTITVNGRLQTSNAQINAGGSAADLTLVVTGALDIGFGARLVGNIQAGSVANSEAATFGGSLSTTTGDIYLGFNTDVAGSISSTSGRITLSQANDVGGSITSTSGAISLGFQDVVDGSVTTSGPISLANEVQVRGKINGGSGSISLSYRAKVTGTITSSSGQISIGQEAVVSACVRSTASAEILLNYHASVDGVCCGTTNCKKNCVTNNSQSGMPNVCADEASGPHHVEIRHGSGTGVTCSPSTLTVMACTDAACATPYTGGVTGSLNASGAGITVNWPNGAGFVIGSGSSSTTINLQVTKAGSVMLSGSGFTPAAAGATTCNFGNPACTFTAADSGLVIAAPDHVADRLQTPVNVSAVRKSDNSAVCVPAFAGVSKSVTFTCTYQNPGDGSLPVRIGGFALNAGNNSAAACDTLGRAVNLAFNASGTAATTLQYADAGEVRLDARHVGTGTDDKGLVMTGNDSFIAAPASFAFSAITAGPIKAGAPFAATVTARNDNGATTPNFGRENTPQTATLAFARAQPTGAGARDGVFTGTLGAFNAGVASAANLVWSEVGTGDLRATLTSGNYLGSGLTVSGATSPAGAVGRFIPHHFDVVVTPACGTFSYAAQPFSVQVSAMNGLVNPGTTVNYDGSLATAPNFARSATLSDAPALGVGSFGTTGLVAASTFSAGVATTLTPAFAFTSKLTAEQTLKVRAIDADAVSSSGFAEGTTALRSGRLRLSNVFGRELSPLPMPVQAQYWSGNDWIPNGADSCTSVPAAAVARSGYLDHRGVATTTWTTTASAFILSAGAGTLTLSPPGGGVTGSVDVALNLGSGAADQSCLAVHPGTVGAALPWLRSQQGNCSILWDRDPAARASFGIHAPESRKLLYGREIF